MNMTLEQARQLKKEASALYENLFFSYRGPAVEIVKTNPFAELPEDLAKIKRVMDKAYERWERRRELYADVKWPHRVELRKKYAAASALRAIPSEKRAQTSRENGKLGGRPRKQTD